MSDFHWPLAELDALLASFAPHELVPVVVWDAREFELAAPRGLAQMVDPESGQRRTVWWRPALRERWAAQHAARREALRRALRRHRLAPLMIEGAYRADDVTRYFQA